MVLSEKWVLEKARALLWNPDHTGFNPVAFTRAIEAEVRNQDTELIRQLVDAPQPAHSGEPVAWLDPWTGTRVTTDPDAYGKHGIPLVRQQRREQPCA